MPRFISLWTGAGDHAAFEQDYLSTQPGLQMENGCGSRIVASTTSVVLAAFFIRRLPLPPIRVRDRRGCTMGPRAGRVSGISVAVSDGAVGGSEARNADSPVETRKRLLDMVVEDLRGLEQVKSRGINESGDQHVEGSPPDLRGSAMALSDESGRPRTTSTGRMRELEELRRAGFITDSEYESKRVGILADLLLHRVAGQVGRIEEAVLDELVATL
jgi:hypothetical protein